MNTPSNHIHIHLTRTPNWQGNLLIQPTTSGEKPNTLPGQLNTGELWFSQTAETSKPGRYVLHVGLRQPVSPEDLRQAGGSTANWLIEHPSQDPGLDLRLLAGQPEQVSAFCEGLLLGGFRFSIYKEKPSSQVMLHLLVDDDRQEAAYTPLLNRATAVVRGVNLARAWAHEPPNVINPHTLAERARALAARTGLQVRILDEQQLSDIGAGALLAVGQGSATPARLIVLEHPGVDPDAPPIVLVGKAITFDTGGYSLKARTKMVGMKYDKAAGMTVIGILAATAALKLEVRVIGIVAAAENMIAGHAYRPNDIIRSLSGKTIEIISTDAEGRLVLADALTYAQQTYQPAALIDLATLTGGIVTALGRARAGVMANHDRLAAALLAAGERTHERLWRMPLDEEYVELIRGEDSDLKNSTGSTVASPIVGATFLKQFVAKNTPWAHIDIAGTARTEKGKSYAPKGATGFGVRLMVDFLEHWTRQGKTASSQSPGE